MNVYGKAALNISTVRGEFNSVNGNPRKKGVTESSDGPPTVAGKLLLWIRIVKQAYAKRRITYAKFWESHQVSDL